MKPYLFYWKFWACWNALSAVVGIEICLLTCVVLVCGGSLHSEPGNPEVCGYAGFSNVRLKVPFAYKVTPSREFDSNGGKS